MQQRGYEPSGATYSYTTRDLSQPFEDVTLLEGFSIRQATGLYAALGFQRRYRIIEMKRCP